MRILKVIMFLALMSVLAVSCKKDKIPLSEEEVELNQETEKVRDGMLQFSSKDAFYSEINYLGSLSPAERLSWSESNGLKTQQIIIDDLILAQISFEIDRYAGIDEDISVEELKRIGLEPEWCPEIKKYEASGLIKTKIEEDGSISFDPATDMFETTSVINEEGFVLIGGDLYLYEGDKIKVKKYESDRCKSILASANSTDLERGIHVHHFGTSRVSNEKWRMMGNIFDMNYNGKIWYYPGEKERFEHYIVMYSFEQQSQGANALHYHNFFLTRANAEEKKWGSWQRRDTYEPIRTLTGAWNWNLYAYQPPLTIGYTPEGDWYFSPPTHSPLSVSTPFSNELWRLLYPTGDNYLGTVPDESVNYFDLDIYGTFAGGNSGYSTHYHL
ncbi:MAG: hypothetical protein AB8B56_10485 [Crocinitomicaceae bacterium]